MATSPCYLTNSYRQHSYLDYTNPMEFEAKANVA